MLSICMILCIFNSLCLVAGTIYFFRKDKAPLPNREDEKNEEERKVREERLNEVFDYDPYGQGRQ